MSTPVRPSTNWPTEPDEIHKELRRLNGLHNPRGLRLEQVLDQEAPPATAPRDLSSLATAIAGGHAAGRYLFHPAWNEIVQVHRHVAKMLWELNTRADRPPEAAAQAARITVLAASYIARRGAEVSASLHKRKEHSTPGGEAMRILTATAEKLAAHAAGLEDGQKLDTPRPRVNHIRKLNSVLRQAAVGAPEAGGVPGFDNPGDAALDSALTRAAAADDAFAEAATLMSALGELSGWAQRAAHRVVLDVKLHGAIETAQLRGFEIIARIARRAMRRYERGEHRNDRLRSAAADILHHAGETLERMRGTLREGEEREEGFYEENQPARYRDALSNRSRAIAAKLRSKELTPRDRIDLQIRFILAESRVNALEGMEYPVEANFPPKRWVAGMATDTPVKTRIELIRELNRRVRASPHHRNASILNRASDLYLREITGSPELTLEARKAEISAEQIRVIAQFLVTYRKVASASPLMLSDVPELNVTYEQAERTLDVLHRLGVVGPVEGMTPREVVIETQASLERQLMLLEDRLPNLLYLQEQNGPLAAAPAPPSTPDPRAPQPKPSPAPAAGPRIPPTSSEKLRPLPRRALGVPRPGPANLNLKRQSDGSDEERSQPTGPLGSRGAATIKEVFAGAAKRSRPVPGAPTPPEQTGESEAQQQAHRNQPGPSRGMG